MAIGPNTNLVKPSRDELRGQWHLARVGKEKRWVRLYEDKVFGGLNEYWGPYV